MMSKIYSLSVLFCTALLLQAQAQVTADYALQLEANVQSAPPKITLNWKKIPSATQYNIFKKAKGAFSWTSLSTTSDTFYVDAAVLSDTAYEYKVTNTGGVAAGGCIYAGINTPAIHNKGTMVLLVDTLFRDSCAANIAQLMQDLSADGWAIVRHDVSRTMPDTLVKKIIKADYTKLTDVQSVLIVGHIAVPYSGELNPDGHTDHIGAWPADVFYADMDGTWTDVSINNTSASRTQNKNIPGDGKWDQSSIASSLELQISRIDFANMPLFAKSEVAMMKSYLAKAHSFKMDSLYVSRKAIVDDNFGAFGGEAFAANAWRNCPSGIGSTNIIAGDFITTLNDSAYLWGYGCGGGSYTSCGGVGTTSNFVSKNQKGIFTMLFGSYFGDWDATNNFLRAPLCCDEPALTCCWAGRPNWFLHHLNLGENIGYGTLLTHNNTGQYTPYGYGTTGVHVALMGDLSLRSEYIKPASNVVISSIPKGAKIDWAASPDASVLGYYVYKADSIFGKYTKISGIVSSTTFNDTIGKTGLYYYMVRPVKLQETYSGTYYNLGLGVRDSATVSFPTSGILLANSPSAQILCYPNPTKEILNIYANIQQNTGMYTLRIIDQLGKIVYKESKTVNQAEFTNSINTSLWHSGVYFVQISIGNNVLETTKLIKD